MKKNNKLSRRLFLGISASVVTGLSVLPSKGLAGLDYNSVGTQVQSIHKGTASTTASPGSLRIALAQIRRGKTISEGVQKIEAVLLQCSRKGVDIVCFPETYLPGLRGGSNDPFLPPPDQAALEKALQKIQAACKKNKVAAIVGMEWVSSIGLENRAFVISAEGNNLGYQTKNQITPGGEEENYSPENKRRLFSIKGVPFGIVICHEGWRYPETVRWAAVRGAKIIFQPQVTGNDSPRESEPKPWGQSYYEMAMILRSKENSIYFASVNEAMASQNSATSLIDPNGNLMDHLPIGLDGLMITDLNLANATGFYASRYRPELYQED